MIILANGGKGLPLRPPWVTSPVDFDKNTKHGVKGPMATIHVINRAGEKHEIEGKAGATLMEVLRDNDMDVEAICGGCCSCATCHVFIDEEWAGKLPARSEDEQELVEETESYKEANSRLSCQIAITDDLNGLSLVIAPEE